MSTNESIFRRQNIDSLSSPEQLNDYIKSATPGVWFILIAIIFLLVGICVWGIWGHLDTTITAGAICEDGKLTIYIPEKNKEMIKPGMSVTVDKQQYTLSQISASPIHITEQTDPYLLHISELSIGDFCFIGTIQTDLPGGIYTATVTVESVSPLSFVFN